MSAEVNTDSHLEIGHVLFIDVVGYSKLLTNEQRDLLRQLNEVVRASDEFRAADASGKIVRVSTATAWC